MNTTYKDFQEALKIVNNYKNQIEKHYKEIEKQHKEINKFAGVTKETKLIDSGISVRLFNILRGRYIIPNKKWIDEYSNFKDLENLTISEFLKLRNSGKKSLQELKEVCFYAGVTLLP